MVTSRIALFLVCVLALPALAAAPAVAVNATGADRPVAAGRAQELPPEPRRRVRTRVEIHPAPIFRRECVDMVREVWRPYWGYVVTPGMRCWWIRE
jgi:hypothetical protein